jgi:hypothetical protein
MIRLGYEMPMKTNIDIGVFWDTKPCNLQTLTNVLHEPHLKVILVNSRVHSLVRRPGKPTEESREFPQPPETVARILFQIRLGPLLYTSFPTHCLCIILPFNTI